MSEWLAQAGHRVVGLARHAEDAEFPGELVTVDLTGRDAAAATLTQLAGRHAFDGVVNNVAVVKAQPLGDIALSDLDAVLHGSLDPALLATQALLPGMRKRGWGRVVNLSSLTVLGIPERTAYAAAKSAMISFTRTWALELAATGITVNAVAPGPTETAGFRAVNPAGSASEERYRAAIPMRRFGAPREIAAAIGFLLSDDAGFITGQTLFVDGGASIGKSAI